MNRIGTAEASRPADLRDRRRGVHSEDFSHYEEMPNAMALKVIEESKKAKEAPTAEK